MLTKKAKLISKKSKNRMKRTTLQTSKIHQPKINMNKQMSKSKMMNESKVSTQSLLTTL